MIKELLKRHNFLVLAAIFFALSFNLGIAVNSIAFGLFLIVGIGFIIKDISKKELILPTRETHISLLVLFGVIIFRELLINPSESLPIVNTYMAFLLLPLIIAFQSRRLKEVIPIILMTFFIGSLLNVSVNFGYAIFRGIISNDGGINFWYFTYDFFAEPFGIQPIYQGVFYVFSILILNQYEGLRKRKVLYYFSFALLAFGTVLLAARNAIACLLVLVPLFMLIERQLNIKKVIGLAALLAVVFIIALQNPVVKNRVLKVNKTGNFFSGTSLRENIWESAWNVAEKEFIFGVGEKKGSELLLQEYETKKLSTPLKYNYHAHNQFLQILLQYGILGLIVLITTYAIPMFKTNILRNYLGLFWCILFVLTSITESVFARQWGIFSYAFFSSLFLLDYEVFKSK